jgi:hypothetical protein
LHCPRFRFFRRPGQHSAVFPISAQGQPVRFLSSGQSTVPEGSGGGVQPPSGPQYLAGGSLAKNASALVARLSRSPPPSLSVTPLSFLCFAIDSSFVPAQAARKSRAEKQIPEYLIIPSDILEKSNSSASQILL